MKTYVIHRCDTRATSRREIREPIERDLNDRPQRLYTEMAMPNMFNMADWNADNTPISQTHMTMTRVVFETHRVITMQWIEVEERDFVSHGYYNTFTSYYQMPSGITSNDMFEVQEGEDINARLGTISHRMTEEQFYRQRILELEQQVRAFENKNTETEIEEPIVQSDTPNHFDDEIFEWSESENEM